MGGIESRDSATNKLLGLHSLNRGRGRGKKDKKHKHKNRENPMETQIQSKSEVKTDGNMNRIRWRRIFDLFPNLENLIIYTTDEVGESLFPFSLTEAIRV